MTTIAGGRWAAGAVLLLSLLAGLGFDSVWVTTPRQFLFDSYQRIKPRQINRLPAIIIDIDESSVQALGQWPWPRTLTAKLVDAVASRGPLSIAFDIFMPEADRLSPGNVAALHPRLGAGLRAALSELPSNDQILGETLRHHPVVLAWAGLHGFDDGGVQPGSNSAAVMGERPALVAGLATYDTVLVNVPDVEAGGFGFGLVNTERDPDGVVRQVPLVMRVADKTVPSLAFEALRVGVGVNWITLLGDESALTGVQLGDASFDTDSSGKITLYYSKPDPRRRYSAVAVLNGDVPKDAFAGKIAFIGVTALGLTDVVSTPVDGRMDGVEVHVQVIENLLDGEQLIRPSYALVLESGLLASLGILLLVVLPRVTVAAGAILVVVVSGCLVAGSFVAFSVYHHLFDVTYPATTLAVMYVLTLASMLAQSNRDRRALDIALQRQRVERARLAGELDAARDIQLGMLPTQAAFDQLPGSIRLHAFLQPAREVGGDLYDVCMLDDRHVFFLIGDVTGKGVPASLFMALSKALCKNVALRTGAQVGLVTREVNRAISRENPAELFVTAIAGVIDTETGSGELCIAGHDSPMVFKPGEVPRDLDGIGGPPLCVVDDFDYPTETFTLSPGETLLLWTDGVGEAQAPASANDKDTLNLYGRERLRALVASLAEGIVPSQVVERIYREVKQFSGGEEMTDDVAIMAIQYLGVNAR